MKYKLLLSVFIALLSCNLIFGQNPEDPYKSFIKNGIEYKTNGKDTICIVDPMPQFKNGINDLTSYLCKIIKYPAKAIKDGIEGKVIISFTIDSTGKVTKAKVLKSVDPCLDKEALRVVNKMPKWNPGKQKGKPVPVEYSLPISFKL